MKTGIITLVGNNYGNRLQNYAVQELLNKYGEVYTVRYGRKAPQAKNNSGLSKLAPAHAINAVNSRLLNKYHLSDRRKSAVARVLYFANHRNELKQALSDQNSAFRTFDDKYIKYEKELLHLSGDDDEPWVKSYDAWVCGSDQIWNPMYPTATRNAFLQFAQKERRIALSPSIGLSDTDAMLPEYPQWINGIPYLSVREERGAEIIKELTGRKAEVFLDPTMLIPLSCWNDVADAAHTKLPEKYAVGYFLGIREKNYMKYIDGRIQGLPFVDILNGERPEYLSFGPDNVIEAIRNAEVVFVDSFHGAVFSILFHKQFIVFERKEDGKTMNSRLETLLKKFGLENRVYREENVTTLLEPIDYNSIDLILDGEKKKVWCFLDNAMSEIEQLQKEEKQVKGHIQISRPEKCTGCTACFHACPQNCIEMRPDAEGFVYPIIDETKCIQCGKCQKVCPVLNNDNGKAPTKVLANKNKDEKTRATSSSGGVFFEIAKAFLQQDGIVYGCALNDEMVAEHICIENINELERLKSSKYVQSDMGNIMSEIKEHLINGRKVLFSGTPCQTAGLRNFLGKEYPNLFVVDILCHGVPSPKLFADYLTYLGKKSCGDKPVSVNFRCKQRGWKRLYMEVEFQNGKRHYIYSGYDRYESLFLQNMSLRPSCYECKFTKSERYGDITLGDFWGIGKKYPRWDDDKGISVVMINTNKGQNLYGQVEQLFDSRTEDFELAKAGQRTLYAPTQKNPNRDKFYQTMISKGTEIALEEFTSVPSLPVRAYYAAMRWGLDLVRGILRKGY